MSAGNNMSGSDRRRRRKLVARRDGRQCNFCGSQADLTLDHIIPKSAGGTNALRNLQLLCRGCNEAKGSGGYS